MERHHRIRVICHAIRHLLDGALQESTTGDVEAIDILQSAIHPSETDSAPVYEMARPSAEAASPHIPHNRKWQARSVIGVRAVTAAAIHVVNFFHARQYSLTESTISLTSKAK